MAFGDRRARVRPNIVGLNQRNTPNGLSIAADAIGSVGKSVSQIAQGNIETAEQVSRIEHETALREHARTQQATVTDGMARWAGLKADITVWNSEQQANAAKGGEGYEEALAAQMKEKLSEFRSSLGKDEEVQQRFAPVLAEFEAGIIGKGTLWAAAKRSATMKADSAIWLDTTANGFAATQDPSAYEQALKEWAVVVQSVPGVDGDGKAELARHGAQRLSQAFFDGLVDNGQQDAAAALLESGHFDGVFEQDQMKTMRRQVGLAQDRAVREQELEATRAQSAVNDEIDRVELRIKNGLPVTEAEFRALQAGSTAAGMALESDQLEIWRIQAGANEQFAGMGINELKSSKAALRAKVDAAGRKAKPGDILALGQIDGHIDRKQDAAADQYKEIWAKGLSGQIAVGKQLQALPMSQAVETAKRLDPSGTMRYAVQLHPGLMAMERDGAVERAANPELVPSPAKLNTAFQTSIGRAGRLINGDQMAGIREVAANLYASAAKKNGWKEFNADAYAGMISVALGKRDGKGGLGKDIRGLEMILPAGVSEAGFQTFQSRHDFAGAAEPANVVKKYFSPVWHNDAGNASVYVMVNNRGERLQSKKGGDYYWKVQRGDE